jgi:site-specific DNA-methyltransferase (adenine-specific)
MMGAGAALVAAVQNGRHAIGIEINEHWFEVACARVRKALA